jgi:K+-sensing histidine kinase KdpD
MPIPSLPTVSDPPDSDAAGWNAASVFRHVSHELRQPLSAMEAIAYYLEIVLPLAETKARDQVRKLQVLIEQASGILSDATNTLQEERPELESQDLNELISSYLADAAIREHTQVDLSLGDDIPLVAIDPAQMRHLLGNLLRLVRRGAVRQHPMRLATTVSAGMVTLEVEAVMQDCGAAELAELFHRPELHSRSGSGLAAAGILRIARAHSAVFQAQCLRPDSILITLSLAGQPAEAGCSTTAAW